MDVLEFEEKLNKIGLSKKDFAEKASLPYQTIMNWKRNDSVPAWVKSWLENYIAKKKFDNIKEIIKEEID